MVAAGFVVAACGIGSSGSNTSTGGTGLPRPSHPRLSSRQTPTARRSHRRRRPARLLAPHQRRDRLEGPALVGLPDQACRVTRATRAAAVAPSDHHSTPPGPVRPASRDSRLLTLEYVLETLKCVTSVDTDAAGRAGHRELPAGGAQAARSGYSLATRNGRDCLSAPSGAC